MNDKRCFAFDDLRRLNEITNRTFEELDEIPTAPPEIEILIQALSEAADALSFITDELMVADEETKLAENDL